MSYSIPVRPHRVITEEAYVEVPSPLSASATAPRRTEGVRAAGLRLLMSLAGGRGGSRVSPRW